MIRTMSHRRFASSLIGFTLWIALVPFSALWAAEPDFLTLGEIKELLLKRNVELKISQKEILMTEAQLQSHRADFFPTLSSEARYSRQGEAQRIQIDRGAFSTLPTLPVDRVEIPFGAETNYGLRLTLGQTLFAGGAIQSAYEEAKLKSRQAGMTHQQKIQDQLLRAELLFWTILKTDQLRKVAEQQVSHLGQHLKEVEIFHQEGVLPQNEVLKTKVRLAEAQQRLLTTENNFRLAKMALNLLLHRPVEIPFELANPEEKIPAALPPVEAALQTADERRPTLQAERMQVRIMRTKERLVKSDYYPKLSFLLSYDRSKETPMTLPENWEAMFLLRWNLWDWGKRTQEVKLAKLKTEQSEESVRAAEEALSLEVHERYLRVAETKEKIAMTKVVVEQAEENLRITQERFESNMTSNTEVLDAENLLTSSRANYANAFYDFQLENALFRSAIGLQAEGEG